MGTFDVQKVNPIDASSPPECANAFHCHATTIAPGVSTDTVVSATPCCFHGIQINTIGTALVHAYDNAIAGFGNIVGAGNVIAGQGCYYGARGIECDNGLTVGGSATNPGVTIFWH